MRKSLACGGSDASRSRRQPRPATAPMYAGIDAGVMFPKSQNVFGSIDFTDPLRSDFPATSFASVRYKVGYDVDLERGYDFGMFRLEGELGYKHAKVKSTSLANNVFVTALNFGSGNAFTSDTAISALATTPASSREWSTATSISAGMTASAVMSVPARATPTSSSSAAARAVRLAAASRRLYADQQQYRHRAEVSLSSAPDATSGSTGLRLHARSRHLRSASLLGRHRHLRHRQGIGSRTACCSA